MHASISNLASSNFRDRQYDPAFTDILKLSRELGLNLSKPEIEMMHVIYNATICEYDIDGTAMDTEPKIREAVNAIAAETGFAITEDHWNQHFAGIGDKKIGEMLAGWHAPFGEKYQTGAIFEQARIDRFIPLIDTMKPNMAVWKAVDSFMKSVDDSGNRNKLAIPVTNSRRHIAEKNLRVGNYDVLTSNMTVAGQQFLQQLLLVSEDEVLLEGKHPKPDPFAYEMGYLLSRLTLAEGGMDANVARQTVVTFEDSKTGLRSAIANGHVCFQIIQYNQRVPDSTIEDWVKEGMELRASIGKLDEIANLQALPANKRYFPVTLEQLDRVVTPLHQYTLLRQQHMEARRQMVGPKQELQYAGK